MTHPTPIDGKCSTCGATAFMLAKDHTVYERYDWDGSDWEASYSDTQSQDTDEAVRFFCNGCGTQHAVPFGAQI